MTADEFSMDSHFTYHGRDKEWDISVRDGGMKAEFSVYDEMIQEVVKDNFDDFSDTIKERLIERVKNMWDNSEISYDVMDEIIGYIEVLLS